ncbi:MAG TPA: NAD-dependent epimerase/dehydratase family protein [Gaiellaceae bacterium]|nr:NAD-dependent epimerase/dehydratase family protein [Gaiellaceae bacterium]
MGDARGGGDHGAVRRRISRPLLVGPFRGLGLTGAAFVTGGTGFLGGAIVERLLADGRIVKTIARSDESAHALRTLGAEPVRGDILDAEALTAAMRGCEVVYHAAGVNALCLRDPSPLFEVNVRGSRNVVYAAAAAGVRRVVYTSSAAAVGEARGTVGTETSPHRGWFLSSYERSKFEAEQAVLRAARETGIEVICANPASVQGPGRATGSTKLLLDYLNGKLKAIVDSTISLVDIADCTEGHLLAEVRGEPGERYVLSGATVTVREGIQLLDRLTGIDEPVRALPPAVATAAAVAVETAARLRRTTPRVCRDLVRTALHGHSYDGSRAERELGLSYTPLEETIRRTVGWFLEQGLVDRRLPRTG